MQKNVYEEYLKYLCASLALLLICSCDKQMKVDDGYVPEFASIEATEHGEQHVFETNAKFELSQSMLSEIDSTLKDARAKNIENIAFTIISDKPVNVETREKVKAKIISMMYKHGFIKSRIIDKGVCIYKDAKPSIRISILRYDVKKPDCSPWSEYIGDVDSNKNLPKYGFSYVYNLDEMIANKADLASPREYIGPQTDAAVSSAKKAAGGS